MKTASFRLFSVSCLLMVLGASQAQPPMATQPEHWFVDSLVKVFPEDAPGTQGMPDPTAAGPRNGHASIQLALRPNRRMEKVTVSVEGLGEGNQRKADVQVRLVGHVVVAANTKGTPKEEIIHSAPALFPDVLYDSFQVSLEPQRTQCLWVAMTMPGDAPPGIYRAEMVIREDGIERVRAPFKLSISHWSKCGSSSG